MKSTAIVAGNLGTIQQYNNLREDAKLSAMLQITANSTPDSNVNLQEGYFTNSTGTQVDISLESITNLTFPTTAGESWYILISIDDSGIVTRTYGASAVSPTKPSIPALHFQLAYVLLAQGGTVINDSDIEDVRSSLKTSSPIEVESASLDYMLGDTGTIGKAYSLVDYEQLIGTTANDFGSVDQPEVSQSFYAQNIDITTIKLMINMVASPSDDVLLEIQTDNAGVPSGAIVTNGTSDVINYTTLSGTSTEETFNFSSVPELDYGSLYHFVVKRSGVDDAVNYYQVGSAGSDVQIGTASLNTGTWANAIDDLYFKLTTGYKLAKLGGINFIGICQLVESVGTIVKFNTGYDNNQTGLTTGSYYGYNETNGAIELGGNFKAINETELSFNLIHVNNSIYGDGSDGALVILNGETVTLSGGEYNYSYINIELGGVLTSNVLTDKLYIKCSGKTTIDGNIDLVGKGNAGYSFVINGETLTNGTNGNGGGGGSGIVIFTEYYGGSGGPGGSLGYGGGGGGGAAAGATGGDGANGGNGGAGGTPGGVGGAGGATAGDGADAYSNIGGGGIIGGGNTAGVAGGISSGGGGASGYTSSTRLAAGGGGGSGGISGAAGCMIILVSFTLYGAGNILTSGSDGDAGGAGGTGVKGTDTSGGGGGGGGGGGCGGGGGAIYIQTEDYTHTGIFDCLGGIGGAGGAGGIGQNNLGESDGNSGAAGSNGAAGNKIINYK